MTTNFAHITLFDSKAMVQGKGSFGKMLSGYRDSLIPRVQNIFINPVVEKKQRESKNSGWSRETYFSLEGPFTPGRTSAPFKSTE